MLKFIRIILLLLIFNSSVWGHTFNVGNFPVPGACVVSDFAGQSNYPWQTSKPIIRSLDGVQRVSLLVLPSKEDDSQTESERVAVEQCVSATGRSLNVQQQLVNNSSLEDDLRRNLNSCLFASRVRIEIRYVAIRKGEIECPDGMVSRP